MSGRKRVDEKVWRAVRADFEAHQQSLSELARRYNINKSSISRRARKEGWNAEHAQRIIEKSVNVIKDLSEVRAQAQGLDATLKAAVAEEVDQRLHIDGIFVNSLTMNQKLANQLLQAKVEAGELDMNELDAHSKITARNREAVSGKPQTQVNVQTNVAGTDANAIIEELRRKHDG